MKIASVVAAAVTDTSALGRSPVEPAGWHDQIDHMNPLADQARYAGQALRFEPPWTETICVVTAEDGRWGMGMTALAGLTVPLINDYLAPMLVSDDCDEIERLWDMMSLACGSHFGAMGVASYAISAVDLALWDLRGRRTERPVYDLLGGTTTRDPVPCYATGLDVAAYRQLGFNAFKLPCPWDPDPDAGLEQTVELVCATRTLVGADASLMLDCWAVHQVDHAVAIGEAMHPFELIWIEDYIYPEHWLGYAEVRARLATTTLAAGERWYTTRPFEQAIAEGWVDVVQPDPLWVGGATPAKRIADMAAASDVTFSLHCGCNDSYGQHLSYGLPGNRWAEMYIGSTPTISPLDSYRSTPGMTAPVDGCMVPSDAPGFGIELSLDDIERATR